MTQGKRLLPTLNTRKDDARKQATAGFVPLLLVTNLARFRKKKKTRVKKQNKKKNNRFQREQESRKNFDAKEME